MALFGSKKKKEEAAAPETKPAVKKSAPKKASAPAASSSSANFAHVLKHTRITEKASMHQGSGVYTFDVEADATKTEIAAAVRSIYKVAPRKIRIVQIPAKQTRSMRTGKRGTKSGGKKAYVYLKSGETIAIA